MKYGYARVSSHGQNHDGQVEALQAAGCERIFREKASGKSTNGRHELTKVLKALKPGDTLVTAPILFLGMARCNRLRIM